jgi:hypothetical protein
MTSEKTKHYFLDESEISFDKIDFKWAIVRHLDRIGNMTSITQTEKQASVEERERLMVLSIRVLEMMLLPYCDNKYAEDITRAREHYAEQNKEMAYALYKLGALMRLLHRKGFLMKGYTIGFGGQRDIDWFEGLKKREEDKALAKTEAVAVGVEE